MTIAERMKTVTAPVTPVVWKGPEDTGPQGGITQSMLGRALNCWERFRVYAVEGLRPHDRFNHRAEYGNLFHKCEETHAAGGDWVQALTDYCTTLCDEYPLNRADVFKWFSVCRVQFPVYLEYWKSNPEQVSRMSLLQEQVFDVPYRLPSGRTVRLRGKWDGVSLVDGGLFLDECKTKGDVDCEQIARNLTFDNQVMLYLVALRETAANDKSAVGLRLRDSGKLRPIRGVRYNVIRRPLSGGKGTIVQKKGSKNVAPETESEYYARLSQYIKDEPETYFFRWTTEITATDIERFEAKFLRPFLSYLCMWYDHITYTASKGEPAHYCSPQPDNDVSLHWTRPFGIENYLDVSGFSDYDSYLFTGQTTGLTRVKSLFRELEE